MALPRLVKRTVLKGYVETSYGTPPTDWSSSDVFYIPAEDITFNFPRKTQRRNLMKPTFGADAEYVTAVYGTISFTCELRGDGTDGGSPANLIEPVVGKLLRACMYNKTDVETDPDGTPSSGDEYIGEMYYTPTSNLATSGNSLSFKLWYAAGEDDKAEAIVLAGCIGTYTIRAGGVGERVMIEFNFTGKIVGDPVAETLPTITYPDQKPLFLQNMTFTVGSSTTYCLGGFEINGGNDVRLRECASEADGIVSAIVTSRKVTGNFSIEGVLPGTSDPEHLFTKFKSGETINLSIELDSGDEGNHVIIELPHIQINDLANENKEDILFRRLNFTAIDTGSDDDIKIRFLI